jgi:hypothetical protein
MAQKIDHPDCYICMNQPGSACVQHGRKVFEIAIFLDAPENPVSSN